MMFRTIALSLAFSFLLGCSDWPDLDIAEPAGRKTSYPDLAPIDRLLAEADGTALTEGQEESASLEARAAALRARARVLSQPAEDREALEEMRRRLSATSG